MTLGHPKPKLLPKPRKPLPSRKHRLARKAKPKRGSRIAKKSPYSSPEWAKLRRQVRKRSRGICEECTTEVAVECHHRSYAKGKGVKKLLVDLDQLVDLCERCHRAKHPHLRPFERAA